MVSLVVVVPHLMCIGPSRCMSESKRAKDAIVEATSHIAVSSAPPTYPPNMGICSMRIVSPDAPHPASMFNPAVFIFSSFSWEHSCWSQGLMPYGVRSDASLPAAVNGVCGP